jgi:choline dehydrogenase-like flavoprotein
MSEPEPLASRIWRLLEEDLRTALHEGGMGAPEVRDVVRELAAELPPEYSVRLGEEMDRVAASPFDVDWAVRFEGWVRSLKDIGADAAAIDELAQRASVDRLRAILDRERFDAVADRLEPHLVSRPPTIKDVAQVAIVLADGFGTAGQRFARLLLQCVAPHHEDELSEAMEVAQAQGAGPAASLGATVAQASGRGLLELEAEDGESMKLRVARPSQVVADRLTTDVAIIGSGAAGSTVAHSLARAGRRTLVLERGRLVDPETVDRAGLIREALGTTRRSEALEVLQAECVGGSTLIGDGVAAGLPQAVLDEWLSRGVPLKEKPLRDAFGRVARDIALAPAETTLDKAGRGDKGLEDRTLRLSAGRAERLSMLATLLPRAQHESGFEPPDVLSECRVERLEAVDGRVTRVQCRLSDGRTCLVEAEIVVLAAGAIQSSSILRRSGLGGDAVGASLHFNLTALLLAEYDSRSDVPAPGELRYFEAANGAYVSLTRAADARGTVAGMPGWFEDIAVGRREEGAWAVTAVTVGSTASGRVEVPDPGRRGTRLSFDPSTDLMPLIGAVRLAGADAFDNGARRVRPASRRPLDVRREALDELELLLGEPGELMLISGQPLGGNPMGAQSAGGVIDEDFRVHGVENLFVCDASVVPTATTVYPQLTVMALADYAAARLSDPPAETRQVRPPRAALRRLRNQ